MRAPRARLKDEKHYRQRGLGAMLAVRGTVAVSEERDFYLRQKLRKARDEEQPDGATDATATDCCVMRGR